MTITANLTGPAPITVAELRIDQQRYATLTASDLRGPQPVSFTWPTGSASGVYAINLHAEDTRGCADTTGLQRTVTVP